MSLVALLNDNYTGKMSSPFDSKYFKVIEHVSPKIGWARQTVNSNLSIED